MRRYLCAFGDPTDINTWSNIPYFFLDAGRKQAFLSGGLRVDVSKLRADRLVWNAAAILRMERFGGYQFSRSASLRLARQLPLDEVEELICHFQLFPPRPLLDRLRIPYSHYIDFPLPCLFDEYGLSRLIGKKTAASALAMEREQYQGAKRVVCMSPWAATQVIERCGVDASKVSVVIPGANLVKSDTEIGEYKKEISFEGLGSVDNPIRLVFIGKAAGRKGLDRLVAGIGAARIRGVYAVLTVIGPPTNPFPACPFVDFLGFIDKRKEMDRFLAEVRSCHMGALLSYQEAFGIAAMEYLFCGIPALLTRTGGLSDSVPSGSAIYLEQNCVPEDVADQLEIISKCSEELQRKTNFARSNSSYATWDRAVQDFQKLWLQ